MKQGDRFPVYITTEAIACNRNFRESTPANTRFSNRRVENMQIGGGTFEPRYKLKGE